MRGLEKDGLDAMDPRPTQRSGLGPVRDDEDDPGTDLWIVQKRLEVRAGARGEHRNPRIHWRVKLRVGQFPCQPGAGVYAPVLLFGPFACRACLPGSRGAAAV